MTFFFALSVFTLSFALASDTVIATDNFPPKDKDTFPNFIKVNSWEARRPIFEDAVKYLRSNGASKIGTFGFCWGAKLAVLAGRDANLVQAVGLLHQSLVNAEDFAALQVPIINCPSKDEADQLPLHQALEAAHPELAAKSEHHRFDDVYHGWLARISAYSAIAKDVQIRPAGAVLAWTPRTSLWPSDRPRRCSFCPTFSPAVFRCAMAIFSLV